MTPAQTSLHCSFLVAVALFLAIAAVVQRVM